MADEQKMRKCCIQLANYSSNQQKKKLVVTTQLTHSVPDFLGITSKPQLISKATEVQEGYKTFPKSHKEEIHSGLEAWLQWQHPCPAVL
jgi:hypothetical protein